MANSDSQIQRRIAAGIDDDHGVDGSEAEASDLKEDRDGIVMLQKLLSQDIGDDLIYEILLRLPVVSVLRFKCVSKKWYSLFSNPDYIRRHYIQFHSRHHQPFSGFFFWPWFCYPFAGLEYKDGTRKVSNKELMDPGCRYIHKNEVRRKGNLAYVSVIDSCNGLVLYCAEFGGTWTHRTKHGGNVSFYICNPIIKQHIELPKLYFRQREESWFRRCPAIVFDPSISLTYRIVECFENNNRQEIHVYSSEARPSWASSSWRLWKSFDQLQFKIDYSNKPIYLNGNLYWTTINGDVLLCLNIETDVVSFPPLPPKPHTSSRKVFYFGKCGGRLRLVERYYDNSQVLDDINYLIVPCSFDIMEREEQNGVWTRIHHVIIDGVPNQSGCIVQYGQNVYIMHLHKTGNGDTEAMLLAVNGEMISFNLTSKTFGKKLEIPANPGLKHKYSDVSSYTPTIFPLQ